MIKNFTKDMNFEETINKELWLVDFSATWCGPCKMLEPVLEELVDVNILKVDIDENMDLAQRFGVMSVPTMIFFKDGQEINKVIGYHTKDELEDIIKTLN